MGYMDGELSVDDRRRVEDHLAVCVRCRGELATFQRMGRATEGLSKKEVHVDTGMAWERVYDRLARGFGWLLLWAGLTLLGGFYLWTLGSVFLLNSETPLVVRVGVGSLVGGMLLLVMNILRERLYRDKNERYSEVQR